jgi:hypothetical protein
MDGRRSRYWCGLCSGGETKPVVSPDDYQASGAPRILLFIEGKITSAGKTNQNRQKQ